MAKEGQHRKEVMCKISNNEEQRRHHCEEDKRDRLARPGDSKGDTLDEINMITST